jgi:hypothetical protein
MGEGSSRGQIAISLCSILRQGMIRSCGRTEAMRLVLWFDAL